MNEIRMICGLNENKLIIQPFNEINYNYKIKMNSKDGIDFGNILSEKM